MDKDPSVEIPITAIEDGIRSAAICLADITTDNPNVWYELGFAFATGRPVVMVCSDERIGKKYPFDIQHRTVIPYQADSPRDFIALQNSITTRIIALMNQADVLRAISESESVGPVQGLSQPELVVLATVAGRVFLPGEGVAASFAKNDVERSGFTAIGFSIGVQRLVKKRFIVISQELADNGELYPALFVSSEGWDWIEQNEDKFLLRKPKVLDHLTLDDIPW